MSDKSKGVTFLPLTKAISSQTITSDSVGIMCKQLDPDDFDKNNGFVRETLPTNLDISKIDTLKMMKEIYGELTIQNLTSLIKKRKLKLGETYTCSPVHGTLFPDVLLTDLTTKRGKALLKGSGDKALTKDPKQAKSKKVKVDDNEKRVWKVNDNEKSFNIILYYMEAILENTLKPDLYLQFLSPDSLIRECSLLFVEAKEIEEPEADFYKLLIQSWGSCLTIMQLLYSKTTYLYPIGIPCVQATGMYYRQSLTRCLPEAILDYLSCDSNTEHKFFNHNTFTESIGSNEKKTILERFIPDFLKEKNLLIDTSCVGIVGGQVSVLSAFDDSTGFYVQNEKCVADLAYSCLSLIKYVKMLTQFILKETSVCTEFVSKNKTLDDIRDISDGALNFRFKELSKHSKRSVVYLVEKLEPERWKKHHVIKKCLDTYAFRSEKKYSSAIRSLNQQQCIIMPFFPSLLEVFKEKDSLEWLKLSLNRLILYHSKNVIHGDIKPEHICFDGTKIVLIDNEFVQQVGKPIKGFTRGYHPPEYDLTNVEQIVASTEADIYSLGISFGSIFVTAGGSSEDTSLVKYLNLMTSTFGERFKDANEALDFIENDSQMDISNF